MAKKVFHVKIKNMHKQEKNAFPCNVCQKECFTNCIECNLCEQWCHAECTNMSTEELQIKSSRNESFFCPSCLKNIKNPIEFINTLTKVSYLCGFEIIHYTQYH